MSKSLDTALETVSKIGKSDVVAALVEALELAQVALQHSTPKMAHYEEPRARHDAAIDAINKALKLARGEG